MYLKCIALKLLGLYGLLMKANMYMSIKTIIDPKLSYLSIFEIILYAIQSLYIDKYIYISYLQNKHLKEKTHTDNNI